ncbi:MAG: hypothetical protein NZ960_06405 [Candidatus Kapabacteria bacterium]|nr:hypothetical protein [Candidatus Kapabacteria bacterium]MDW8011398.1 hypothetical protein [Bacteroidota bacterium]
MALVGLHEDDFPLLPTIQQRCDGLSLILAGSPETVDLALQSFPKLSPDGLLLEPFTAQHLRSLLPGYSATDGTG